jgi:hypothetical protein
MEVAACAVEPSSATLKAVYDSHDNAEPQEHQEAYDTKLASSERPYTEQTPRPESAEKVGPQLDLPVEPRWARAFPARLSRLSGRARLAGSGSLALALALVTILVVSGEPGSGGASSRAHLQPTAAPTATLTPSPAPSVTAGFTLYVDDAAGFQISYPTVWSASPTHPGVEFDDSSSTQSYLVQVLPTDASTVPDTSDATSAAASLVDLELSGVELKWGSANFQRLEGPIPPAAIGGQTWQSGIALIGPPTARIRIQVYATIYNGKPFVITLGALDELFARGQQQYFQPMLASFTFLPAPA